MAGYGDQRTLQAEGHILDETGFPAPGRPFEHNRQAGIECRSKQVLFGACGKIIRLFLNSVIFDVYWGCCGHGVPFSASIRSRAADDRQTGYQPKVSLLADLIF